MNYDTVEITVSNVIYSEDLNEEGMTTIPTSLTYEFVDGSEDSPYIITSSTY
jgi:hypothetical protein